MSHFPVGFAVTALAVVGIVTVAVITMPPGIPDSSKLSIVADPVTPANVISNEKQPCLPIRGVTTSFDICVSVFTDPDNGCEYILTSRTTGSSAVSITPRQGGTCDSGADQMMANAQIVSQLELIGSKLDLQATTDAAERLTASLLRKARLAKQLSDHENEAAALRLELGLSDPLAEAEQDLADVAKQSEGLIALITNSEPRVEPVIHSDDFQLLQNKLQRGYIDDFIKDSMRLIGEPVYRTAGGTEYFDTISLTDEHIYAIIERQNRSIEEITDDIVDQIDSLGDAIDRTMQPKRLGIPWKYGDFNWLAE